MILADGPQEKIFRSLAGTLSLDLSGSEGDLHIVGTDPVMSSTGLAVLCPPRFQLKQPAFRKYGRCVPVRPRIFASICAEL